MTEDLPTLKNSASMIFGGDFGSARYYKEHRLGSSLVNTIRFLAAGL